MNRLSLVPVLLLMGCPALGPGVVIGPTGATTVDDLVVSLDPAVPGATYQWSLDGITQDGETGEVLRADLTSKGQLWSVIVSEEGSEVGRAQIVILNAAPTATVSLPPKGTTGRDLVAEVSGEDPDGDTITYQYAWTVDGEKVAGSNPSLSAELGLERGATVEVTVTPTDVENAGESVSASTVMGNGVPSATLAVISPQVPVEADTVTCAGGGWTDPDGDPEGYLTLWRVNGTDVSTDPELTGEDFEKGDEITCTLTPWDGSIGGDLVDSEPVVVGNSPPVATALRFDPAEPGLNTRVSAVLDGLADVDGDDVSVRTEWSSGGKKLILDGGQLSITRALAHAEVSVVATPNDGDLDGAPVSGGFTVANTLPEVEVRSLGSVPRAGVKPEVTAVVTDDDGDIPTLSYEWRVNGTVVDTAVRCSACDLTKGDTLLVRVTADDGWGGVAFDEYSTVVANSPPTGGRFEVDSASGRLGSDVVCDQVAASADADGDTLTYTITFYEGLGGSKKKWTGSTSTTSLTGDTIPSEEVRLDDYITCEVMISDGTDSVGPLSTAKRFSDCAVVPTSAPSGTYPPVALREQGGFCYYLGSRGGTCDQACAYIGGGNHGLDARSSLGSTCKGPRTGGLTQYFLVNGNLGGWTASSLSTHSFKTLGHGDVGSLAYGACSTGTTSVGAFPGESNSKSGRSLVCACF